MVLLVAVLWLVIRSAVSSAIRATIPMPGDWYEADPKGKWRRRRADERPRYGENVTTDEIADLAKKHKE